MVKTIKELKIILNKYGIQDSHIKGTGKNNFVLKADRIKAIQDYESKSKPKKESKPKEEPKKEPKKESKPKKEPKKESKPKTKNEIALPKKNQFIEMDNFKYMYITSGRDRYGAEVSQIGPDKGVLYLTRYSHSDIRVKKNPKNDGYGVQVLNHTSGKWKYEHTSKYRYLSTWWPSEHKVETYIDPGF